MITPAMSSSNDRTNMFCRVVVLNCIRHFLLCYKTSNCSAFCCSILWQDEEAFFADYAASHKKLSELGFTPPSSCFKVTAKTGAILAQTAVGVAVATAVVLLSYFFEVHKRVK